MKIVNCFVVLPSKNTAAVKGSPIRRGCLDYCMRNGLSVGVESARGFVSDALRRGLTQEGGGLEGGAKLVFPRGTKARGPKARRRAESRPGGHWQSGMCPNELRESYRWLLLIQRVPLLRPRLVDPLVQETDELIRIFVRSIQTAEQRKR